MFTHIVVIGLPVVLFVMNCAFVFASALGYFGPSSQEMFLLLAVFWIVASFLVLSSKMIRNSVGKGITAWIIFWMFAGVAVNWWTIVQISYAI